MALPPASTPESREQIRRWAETWKLAGEEMEAIRDRELREFEHEPNWRALDALLRIACMDRTERQTSGLVEQQRLFGLVRARLASASEA